MTDRIALNRSNSFFRSEASDAGSSSSKWDQDDPVAASPPFVTPGSPTPLLALAPSSSPQPIAHTIPTVTGCAPQPSTSNATVTNRVQPVSRPALELHAGVLAINVIDFDNMNIRNLLAANPGIHSVLIQTKQVTSSMSMIDLFGQFVTISSLTTLKFDFVVDPEHSPWPIPGPRPGMPPERTKDCSGRPACRHPHRQHRQQHKRHDPYQQSQIG